MVVYILVFVRPCGSMREESSGGRDEVAWRAASRIAEYRLARAYAYLGCDRAAAH